MCCTRNNWWWVWRVHACVCVGRQRSSCVCAAGVAACALRVVYDLGCGVCSGSISVWRPSHSSGRRCVARSARRVPRRSCVAKVLHVPKVPAKVRVGLSGSGTSQDHGTPSSSSVVWTFPELGMLAGIAGTRLPYRSLGRAESTLCQKLAPSGRFRSPMSAYQRSLAEGESSLVILPSFSQVGSTSELPHMPVRTCMCTRGRMDSS